VQPEKNFGKCLHGMLSWTHVHV